MRKGSFGELARKVCLVARPIPKGASEAMHRHNIGDKAEQAYRRSDALEKRRALMEAWAQWCEPREAGDNVTSLRRKA